LIVSAPLDIRRFRKHTYATNKNVLNGHLFSLLVSIRKETRDGLLGERVSSLTVAAKHPNVFEWQTLRE
ncbi:MAG: hypothetical protein AAGL09_18580, partial [Pseudomonadota bacterium]